MQRTPLVMPYHLHPDIDKVSSLPSSLSLFQIQGAKQAAEEAKDEAQMAYNAAFEAKNVSENARTDLEELLNEISRVIGTTRARPEDVEAVSSSNRYNFQFNEGAVTKVV